MCHRLCLFKGYAKGYLWLIEYENKDAVINGRKIMSEKNKIIIYNTVDGKASVALFAKDGLVWMNQNQLAELFDTSKQNISQHIVSIIKDKELEENSVVKNYFTTASDGKEYNVTYYTGRLGTMLATPLTESEKTNLRQKIAKGRKQMAEYRKAHPVKPL